MGLKLIVEQVSITTRHPFTVARGSTNGYKRAWVRLVDGDGHEGWGEADPSSFYGERLETVLAAFDKLASHLPRDPFDLEAAEDRWEHALPKNWAARAALSAALHDLVGKKLGQPLWRLWGLDPKRTPLSSFTIGLDSPDKMRVKVREAEDYPILKVKLGTDRDEEILRTVRDATRQPLRGGAFHAARRCRRSGRRGPHRGRSVQRRDHRPGTDPPPHGARPRRQKEMTVPRFVAVVPPVPVSRPYIYAVPSELAARVVPGARVVVPLRRKRVIGIVTEAVSRLPSAGVDIKPIAAAPDDDPALSPALLELGRWLSDYYGAPLGLSLRALLPGPLWSVARPAGPAPAAERLLVLTGNGMDSLLERERRFKRAPKRRAVYETVEALGGAAPVSQLVRQLKISSSVLDGLVEQGLARIERVPEMRDPFADLSSPPPPSLTKDQLAAVQGILDTPVHMPVLLHGVTGSGKTLVYLEVLRGLVARGHGAILLVPEIALTPQTVARLRGVFGDQVAVLHSGLSDGERADAWRALRGGERLVAVGPRSAVFGPVQRPGP